jgi:NAD+-dependent protein deacetylase sirtuin 6
MIQGPTGVWTMQSKGLRPKYHEHVLMPTLAHMAIKKLIDEDVVKYLVSQNTDGLHLKSGMPIEKIAELHGNSYKEICSKCKRVYYTDFDTRVARKVHDHRTGRKCPNCGGELLDSIVNFSEPLPKEEFDNAVKNSKICDLALVLGTSMRVTPACELPLMNKKAKLVICNLQKTPYDEVAEMVVHSKIDQFLQLLMDELGYSIPDFIFNFSFKMSVEKRSNGKDIIRLIEATTDLNVIESLEWLKSEKNLISLRLSFNVQRPFKAEITIPPERIIEMALNLNNCTFEYKVKSQF